MSNRKSKKSRKQTGLALIIAAAVIAVAAVLLFVWPGFLNGSGDGANGANAQPTATPDPDLVSGEYTYRLREDGTAMFTGYTGAETAFTLPAEIDGIRVTAFGPGSRGNTATVTVTVPNGIEEVSGNPFRLWESLTAVQTAEDHPTLECVDGVLFTKADHVLVSCPRGFDPGESGAYNVPDGTERIGAYAFGGCGAVRIIRLPDSVTAIDPYGFSNAMCTQVSIPGSVPVIPERAFLNCAQLTRVNLGEGLQFIAPYAFEGCRALTAVHGGPGPVEGYATFPSTLQVIGAGAFTSAAGLTNIIIPEGVTAIGDGAFCANPTGVRPPEVTLPASLTSLGGTSFAFMSRFTVPAGSYAETFCRDHSWFVYPNE